ncbi:type II toxin-antitoxin system VapC family toxin [Chitinimonas koreensis]|uniref:type II toxin-antitoxin system VapC family toxin n=1 Tax=Chitinimonas koreensis TaxID=356302 RepID=UPI00042838D9|nr:type II toxin-antitoxin system VapC family toxin [Chitinimonas koreensis]QNM94671.1 type II toxin-antitoxin system VapC family toxin [Chitinimonas koreensis]
MILVDTSVWIDHLRQGDEQLRSLLESGSVHVHPMVVGELACGQLGARRQVLDLLAALPALPRAEDAEVLFFIEQRRLMGRGIGYVDAHLLASTVMQPPARLWSRDKRLAGIAQELGCAFAEAQH